jgi:hypothetical protein
VRKSDAKQDENHPRPFAAYLSNDRKAVENAFTEDFRFTSPYDDEIDKTRLSQMRYDAPGHGRNYLRNNFAGHVGTAKPQPSFVRAAARRGPVDGTRNGEL